MNEKSFLNSCLESSLIAYENFKALLGKLENSNTNQDSLQFLQSLSTHLLKSHSADQMMEQFHFSFKEVSFQQESGIPVRLILLQLPSTFSPEDWSFTFFEGLTRYKPSEFQDRVIVELGCGIGWITLALAMQTQASKIYGLDINPRAILCSKVNLHLNSTLNQNQKQSLLERVEFHTSDLLRYCRDHQIYADRIIGCIPQVLNPDPDFMKKVLDRPGLENVADEFLYSLSNYTAREGYIEDQFGLGLIAKTIEESLDTLKASGKLILNLGGRPGAAVLDRLFLRRAFSLTPVWKTRVSQAQDTDIQSLVSIEEATTHRFEFYIGHGMSSSVSAKTALAYAKSGGKIAHQLTVYESQPKDTLYLPKVLEWIRQKEYRDLEGSLDLSYTDDTLALEKISFLHSLIEYIQPGSYFPYEETAGISGFREKLASFFERYFKVKWKKENFLIAPSRVDLCKNILRVFLPERILMDSQLTAAMGNRQEILEIPRSADLISELIEKLHPQIVICSINPSETETQETFIKLCETAERVGSRLFLDISELLELSSNPRSNGIFRFLTQNPLPPHVSLICGLVKNRLYQDLEICFIISENLDLLHTLEAAAELTYSRTPLLSQLYYDQILQELLGFQILHSTRESESNPRPSSLIDSDFTKKFIPLSAAAHRAFQHPAVAADLPFSETSNKIRMDYGENSIAAPRILQNALFEAFSKMSLSQDDISCEPEVIQLNQIRYGFQNHFKCFTTFDHGVAPIFSSLAEYCTSQKYRLIFPSGSYGHFSASSLFFGATPLTVPTFAENQFKVLPEDLEKALGSAPKSTWVILCAPVVNPTGAVYTANELHALLEMVSKYQAVVILDSIFSGLEFKSSNPALRLDQHPNLRWAILGGLSKEFAAGGLRIGYGLTPDLEISALWKRPSQPQLHLTLKATLKKVYRSLLDQNPNTIKDLNAQKDLLKCRAAQLTTALTTAGWTPIAPSGGLFLTATPNDPKLIPRLEKLYREKLNILINPPTWTGIPGYFRFVYSIPEDQFNEALVRIQANPLYSLR